MNLDQQKLYEAYNQELKKNVHHGKPAFGGLVHTARLFFRYRKLVKGVKIEDWLEFSKWVWFLSTERHEPFLNLIHYNHGFELAKHRENVKDKVEEPSEPGYWKMLQEIHIFLKQQIAQGKSVSLGKGYLIQLKQKVG